MARPRSENELESLEAQKEALERKIKEVAAREKARQAAEDSRRWRLAGEVAVQQMQSAPESEFFKTMMRLLDQHARSAADRALFGLPPQKSSNGGSSNVSGPSLLP